MSRSNPRSKLTAEDRIQAQLGVLLGLLAFPNAPAGPASFPSLLQAATRRCRARAAARRRAVRSGLKALSRGAPQTPSTPGDLAAEAQ
jgi:hypothetical protein